LSFLSDRIEFRIVGAQLLRVLDYPLAIVGRERNAQPEAIKLHHGDFVEIDWEQTFYPALLHALSRLVFGETKERKYPWSSGEHSHRLASQSVFIAEEKLPRLPILGVAETSRTGFLPARIFQSPAFSEKSTDSHRPLKGRPAQAK